MLKKILIGLVVVILVVLALAATRPDRFHIERSTDIKAPPERISAAINDFHRWGEWSPWENIDPTMKRTYNGAANGVGSRYAWEGNRNIGSGQMEILESMPNRIVIDLHFLTPFEAHNIATFTLEPQGDTTRITWAMDGVNAFFAKVIGLFLDMDKMIGDNFETGLADLRTVAER